MSVIECSNITKMYGQSKALNEVSFAMEANKLTGIIGRNGAGKTTLLKMLAGYIQPTSGRLTVFSKPPFNNLDVSANLILVDDNMNFPPTLTLVEILQVAKTFYPNWDSQLANGLFHYFQLNPKQNHGALSKGMKSTFNMIIGLASRSSITIFDEPTTGMDAAVRSDFYRALLKDYLLFPRTVLLSSHHIDEIEDLLEDILLINKGEVSLYDSVDALKELTVGVKGVRDIVEKWIINQDVLWKETIGTSGCYVVVKDRYTMQEKQKMQLSGLELSSVAISDVCMYLTGSKEGGIDDVFNNR
ncbi:ABC transporter ATP-binding protein [Alkalihalobacillus sp. LMS39]|uniref:ABC transporter ATP-binding protein n=1 Tax=Alkalihalobacillus sp. LMS39 TaxID=2924032 RepID=UPI001FB54E9C|nr:ABC transporter ATP-binding protein [Alkalihalobacillus sp. LMS39]UOE96201.1 ABC transporter ATP-binding protein [Alkalihalobacillus sp. LMS39]